MDESEVRFYCDTGLVGYFLAERNIVSVVFYMLRSILTGLKLSYCNDQTYTYTTSRLHDRTYAATSKWRKIGHSIHFISYTRQASLRDQKKPPLRKHN